jgi:hypothetical protein
MLDKSNELEMEIAELLICSDFLRPVELDRAYAASRDTALPLSTVLLDSKLVDPRIMLAAMQLVKEIRCGRVPRDQARTAMYLMGNYGLSVDETIARLGLNVVSKNPWASHLSELEISGRWKTAKSS